jgi:hypothetical protein
MTARIFVIHPLSPSIRPMTEAFARLWPEAHKFDLLDESLYPELDDKGTITPTIIQRLQLLFAYASTARADGMIFAGSTFGPAVDQARVGIDVPVLKPDEAMGEAAVSIGRRIAVVTTSKRALPVISGGIEAAAKDAGKPVIISTHHVPDAHHAMAAGRPEEHHRLIAGFASRITDCDVLVLGQISMAPAAVLIPPCAGRTVMTTPDSAVQKMRRCWADATGRKSDGLTD